MNKKKGVRIILAPDVRIPKWILIQKDEIGTGKEELRPGRKKPFRYLEIRGGEAWFLSDGVYVRMRYARQGLMAFKESDVFEIRDLNNDLLEHNNSFCPKCSTLTLRRVRSILLTPGPSMPKAGESPKNTHEHKCISCDYTC